MHTDPDVCFLLLGLYFLIYLALFGRAVHACTLLPDVMLVIVLFGFGIVSYHVK